MFRAPFHSVRCFGLGLFWLLGFGSSCTSVAEAEVLLDLLPFQAGELGAFYEPKAWLDIVNEQGTRAVVDVRYAEDDRVRVESPLPIPCDEAGRCTLQFAMQPQKATFRLRIEAADRCGNRTDIVRFESIARALQPYQSNGISFSRPDYQIDDDQDDIVNYAELLLCGRTDWDEKSWAPKHCAQENNPCCAQSSPLEGEMVFFPGSQAHRLASGESVVVSDFWLDATEATWRQLKRCVVAGGCLADQPEHPVRKQMDQVVDLRLPVTGLNPAEAEQLCMFFGKRLMRDREFDFAVAHREGSDGRARFPWDGQTAEIDCQPSEDIAANFSAPGVSCPGEALPVGSYPTSFAARTGDVPLADLAGNVAEWTTSRHDEV